MINNKAIVRITLVAAILTVACLIVALPIMTIVQSKQVYQEGVYNNPSSTSVSPKRIMSSPWFYILASLFTYKAITKYQSKILNSYYTIKQVYLSSAFQFSNDMIDMPGNYSRQRQQKPKRVNHQKKAHQHRQQRQPQQQQQKTLPTQQQPRETSATSPEKPSALARVHSLESNDWTVVVSEVKKNKRHSLPAMATSAKETVIPRRRHSIKPTTTASTSSKKPAEKKVKTVAKDTTITTKKLHIDTNVSTLGNQAWASVASAKTEHAYTVEENDFLSSSEQDVPFLSDSDSVTESIGSPCLSTRSLHEEEKERPNYYSPFSTGFDFGMPRMPKEEDPSSTQFYSRSRLDEYLASLKPYAQAPSVDSITSYTPLTHRSNVNHSILDRLNPPTHQVETTITPSSFKYFDDMMMSNSLYKFNNFANQDNLIKNKREWNAFSR